MLAIYGYINNKFKFKIPADIAPLKTTKTTQKQINDKKIPPIMLGYQYNSSPYCCGQHNTQFPKPNIQK